MSLSQSVLGFISSVNNLQQLYGDPVFSLGILRLLDPEATSLVFSLLGTNAHINNLREIPKIKDSLSILIALGLVKRVENRVVLDGRYRDAVLEGFCSRNMDRSFARVDSLAMPHLEDSGSRDEAIRSISNRKFRSLLESITSASADILGNREILLFCRLVDQSGQITRLGFEFLLQSKKDQLWSIIISSIRYFSSNSIEEAEMLVDLMEIVLKNGIQAFSCRKPGKRLRSWYYFLDSIGVFYVVLESPVPGQHFPELFFAINNTDLFGQTYCSSTKEKYLILETNFKLYAYTTGSYEKSVLALFSRTIYTLPNLIKACLDEGSVVSAFRSGITSAQIVKYLKDYGENVPANIIGQISIWEQKQHRIRASNGYLYHDFLHLSDFQRVLKFVESKGALIFKNEQKRLLVADGRIHEETKSFIRELSK